MTCDTVRPLLDNYINEELVDQARQLVDLHLAGCAACRAELAGVQSAMAAVHGSPVAEEPGAWFAGRLLDRLSRENEDEMEGLEPEVSTGQLKLGLAE